MRPPLKTLVIPLAGLYAGTVLMSLLIHYWFAEPVASLLDMSVHATYGALLSLLILITVVRTVLILHGKDTVTNLIEAWFDKRH